WPDERDWWYVHSLAPLSAPGEGTRIFLTFAGVDYASSLFVNGQFAGAHVGMFSPHTYELTDLLNARAENEIALRVSGAHALPKRELNLPERLWRATATRLMPGISILADRSATLKTQMSFGWDFAPRLLSCGIWDEAGIVITREILIQDACIRTHTSEGKTRAFLELVIDSARDISSRLTARLQLVHPLAEETIREFSFDLSLRAGRHAHALNFPIESPRLWNPWDRGEPNLYELTLVVGEATSGTAFDSYATRFGIREIQLTGEHEWNVQINGTREFLRGANWVPIDSLPGRATADDYAQLLKMAREAGVNALRVWGGGLREKRAFYDLCDELGLLVWQEFPFADALLDRFPNSREHLAFVESECTAIVQTLRNHPALFMWAGGNEFNTRLNRHIVKLLDRIVENHDGTRAFKPASPTAGDTHSWRVWHGLANTRDYRRINGGMLSEFGLQALPALESLAKFLPAGQVFPPNANWEYHHAQLGKLWRYARPLLSDPTHPEAGAQREMRRPDAPAIAQVSPGDLIAASQAGQMRGLQIAIEHARRNKSKFSGCLFWQFNEPWPAISWSVIDYYRVPKAAYHKLEQIYQPVLVSFEYGLVPRRAGDKVEGIVWIVNDSLSDWCEADVRVFFNEGEIEQGRVNVPPDSVTRIGNVQLTLGHGANALRLELSAGGTRLATNEYDLNYCDVGEINWQERLASKLGEMLRQ
ncbi:MAG TPA: glycoside hydrolase family 2 TIM barrel-domain containing protein, partial [Anaerolineae bacterium]